ncbi:MAG TPA: DUF5668 domain-containing protein [Thermoanaerobaculia bacterium]|jgi:hypothetical protein
MHNEPDYRRHLDLAKLCAGAVMLLIGGLAFLDSIDVIDIASPWRWWPLILIGVGAASEIDAIRNRRSSGGFALMGTGIWLLIASQQLLGFTYRTGFPLLVVFVGLGMIVHAFTDLPKEKSHGQR